MHNHPFNGCVLATPMTAATASALYVCVYTGVLNNFSHNGFLSIDFNDDGNDEGKRKQVEMVKLMRFRNKIASIYQKRKPIQRVG